MAIEVTSLLPIKIACIDYIYKALSQLEAEELEPWKVSLLYADLNHSRRSNREVYNAWSTWSEEACERRQTKNSCDDGKYWIKKLRNEVYLCHIIKLYSGNSTSVEHQAIGCLRLRSRNGKCSADNSFIRNRRYRERRCHMVKCSKAHWPVHWL